MKAKLLFSAVLAATLGFGSAQAAGPKHAASSGVKATADETTTEYVDVTDIYASNCGFDIASDYRTASFSTSNNNNDTTYPATGWAIGTTSSWHGGGVLEIGSSYKCNDAAAPSTNANGEKLGGALGLTAAWGGTVQYTQAVILPVGSYQIEAAVYGTQGKSISSNLFGYVENSGTTHYGTTTSFTKGTWTTEKVSFTLSASDKGKLSVGFGAVSGGSGENDRLFVDYVKIYQDKPSAVTYCTSLLTAAKEAANTALKDCESYEGDEKTTLQTLVDKDTPTDYKEMYTLANSIVSATETLKLSSEYKVEDIRNILDTYSSNITSSLGTCTGNMGSTNGQHWSGNASTTYWDSWSGSATDVAMTFPAVTLPKGKYAVLATARTNSDNGYISVKVGESEAQTVKIANRGGEGYGVDTEGNANFSADGTYANNGKGYGWIWHAIEFEVTDDEASVVLSFGAALNNSWVSVCDIKLLSANEADTKEVLAALEQAKDDAQTALDNVKAYYTGTEYTTLENLIKQENPTSYDDIVARTAEINTAIETLNTAALPFYVAAAKKTYPYDVTEKLGTWSGDMVTNSSQHWSGDNSRTYWEQDNNKWSASSWTTSMKFPEVQLPEGTYVLLATGRGSANSVSYMKVSVNNDNVSYETEFPAKGDTGLGVDTKGNATFATDSTYCNNGAGRGWEYRALEFTVAEDDKVVVEIGGSANQAYQWISISDLQLLSSNDLLKEEKMAAFTKDIELATEYLNTIYDADEESKSLTFAYDCIGNEEESDIVKAFEIASGYAVGDEKNSNEIVADHQKYLSLFKSGVKAAFEGKALQTPQEGEKFNVVIAGNDGYNHNGKYLTAKYNASSQGYYAMGYTEDEASYYSQAVELEAVEGETNTFVMSFTAADGTKCYVCTGTNYGGNDNQLRATTEQTKALKVKVEVDLDNIFSTAPYRLVNTANSQYISANGSDDTGFYTANSAYKNFQIVAAAKHSCTLTVTDAQWATFIAPFDAELPSGVTAYSCSAADTDNNLVLVKAESIKANTPYILHAETAVSSELSGYACATASAYTAGALTGTFAKIENVGKDANRYVLQKQTIEGEESVAFFLVKSDDVWCDAYRAYLTMSQASGVTAFTFADKTVDGIGNAALNADVTEVARYNAAGLRIAAPVKGVNLVKYSDGRVVKQIVK